MSPDVGASNPPIIRSVVVLPQPGRAEEAEELAVLDLEVDVVDGDGIAELLDHVHEPDVDRRHGRSHSKRDELPAVAAGVGRGYGREPGGVKKRPGAPGG